MKKLISFLLLFSIHCSAYFTDQSGNLNYESGRFTGFTNVVEYNLDFAYQKYGFVLLSNGQLFMVWEENNKLKTYKSAIDNGTTEIEYPYFISTNDLYKIEKGNIIRLAFDMTHLCQKTVRTNVNPSFAEYFKISGKSLHQIAYSQLPRNCQ